MKGGVAPPPPQRAAFRPRAARICSHCDCGHAVISMRRISIIASIALVFLGLLLFGQGAYIQIKALVAQILLHKAFNETISGGHPVKPWPWADTWPIARIAIRRLHASAIVLAGSSGQALAFG